MVVFSSVVFPLTSANAFNSFVSAFAGWEDMPYADSLSVAVRTHILDRVCTTNDGKYGGLTFHHELAQTPVWPSKIFFFCLTPASSGGATGITDSRLVYEALKIRYPKFIENCETLGVKYTLYLGPDQDTTKGAGRSWRSLWGETKEEAEGKMKRLGYSWEWMDEEVLRCTTPVLKCVHVLPKTNERVFFNQLIAQTANAKEWCTRGGLEGYDSSCLDRFMVFGDGSSMELEPLEYSLKVANDNGVNIQWKEGDVALLDNYLVMHARRLYEGDRKVYASLVK